MSHLVAPIVEVDVDRHGGEEAPAEPPPRPSVGGAVQLDSAVVKGMFTLPEAKQGNNIH
jgi:protein-ribulosamine 3-kinase